MEEKRVNGMQADEAQWSEAQADDTLEDDDGSDGHGVENLRQLRLREFLRDLVRQEGKMEAAELLGVNHKTLTRAEESGEITGRLGDALELLLRKADDAEVARLREAVEALEERVAVLEGGVEAVSNELLSGHEARRAVVADGKDEDNGAGQIEARDGTNDRVGDQAGENSEEAVPVSDRPAPPVAGLGPKKPFSARRLDPEIVTEEPADDDTEVYGAAWPLVEKWRRLRLDHSRQGKSLSWLATQERLLVLELAMLEDHGLTLPPEKQPLRGFGRRGQTNWRRAALHDTRVALRKRELLRWARRILTLWLWRK